MPRPTTGRRAASPTTSPKTSTATPSDRPPSRPPRRDVAFAAAGNILKAFFLGAGTCAAAGALGWFTGGYRLLLLFGTAAFLFAATAYWYGDRFVLGMLGARTLPVAEAPAAHSALERVAAVAGVPKPRMSLLPDGHPRALSVGRGPGGATVVVSRGLLAALSPAELDGVLAHEIAHVARRDVVVQTLAVVVAATLLELSRIGGWLSRALLFVLGPVASAFVHVLLSPRRELAADRDAARVCGSPHGLADALLRLDQASELLEFRASPATEPLYVVNPFDPRGVAALFETHPPLAVRVARLRALDPGWPERLRAA
jgi:heat shock protein HtpX